MFVDLTFAEALKRLDDGELVLDLHIVPDAYPQVADSPYRPGYDWLFVVERSVARALAPWLQQLRYELIGEKGVLCEVLSNAFCHGHRKRADLPIVIQARVGRKGALITVRDSGSGFDFPSVLSKALRGRPYFLIAGNGMKRLAGSTNFHVFYDENGCRCGLLHLFAEPAEVTSEAEMVIREVGGDSPAASRGMPLEIEGLRSLLAFDRSGQAVQLLGNTELRVGASDVRLAATHAAADALSRSLVLQDCESITIEAEDGFILLFRQVSGRLLVGILEKEASPARAKIEILRYLQQHPRN